ncbi:MAG TPA: hypothetical protein IAB69_02180 [Candidatus Coproplasma excrementigallinarum]|uniref:Aldose epimerase n=1 Tax=Candidatus Coproplasma excrementigallinarum TaxID=2840747 RepID=A0A9D1MJ13_9FIRM|nr:hypothetical protein [Candidatus Coproplasma excrementigallinarum]
MLHSVENEFLKLTVDDAGGSMHSLIYKPTGEERLWQGGEAWKSRDVVIFPIIGHAGPFEVCGKSYQLKSHGLARYAVLAAEVKSDEITLSFTSDEESKKSYPFDFYFSINYKLIKNSVKITYFVKSLGGVMPFYVGGHPGMYAPGGSAVIEFENEEHPIIYPIEGGAAALPHLKRFVADKPFFAECKTFQLGSLSGGAIFARTQDGYTYTYRSDCPLWAFWSNENGGDYVCVEPWWGINDNPAFPRELSLKPFMNFERGEGNTFSYELTVSES